MAYRIKISYSTGDSFKNYDTSDYIEIVFNNLDTAKENLHRIKEHYEMYNSIESFTNRTSKEDAFKKNKGKDWFINHHDEYFKIYCLNLKQDNGEFIRIGAFWCGYFERMHFAEIELDNSDMKIEF